MNDLIFFPSIFSPNDDGLNDHFKAYGSRSECLDYTLIIFNRWGEKLFEKSTTLFDQPFWNAIFRNQKVMPGVYFFVAKGPDFERSGAITVVY